MTACIRSRSPNLVSTLETWVLMVPSPTKRWAASSELLLPGGEQLQDLSLSLGETPKLNFVAALCRSANEPFNDLTGDRRCEKGIAGSDDAHRMHELLGRGVLEKEPTRPSTKCFEDVIVALESGEDDDPTGDTCIPHDAAGGLETVHCRHLDVHEHDVRPNRARHGDRLFTIACFADDLDVVFGFEDHLEARSDQCLIVDQHDPDAHAASLFSGNDACTAKPPPARGPARRCPPWSAARSRIPINPWPTWPPACSASAFRSVVEYLHLKFC